MSRRHLRLGPHYASKTFDRAAGELRVWEFVHAHGCCIPLHRHERAHVVVVLAGRVAEQDADGATRHYEVGDAVLHPRGATHANAVSDVGSVTLGIEFEADYLPQLMPDALPRLGRSIVVRDSALDAGMAIANAARDDRLEGTPRLSGEVRALLLRISAAAAIAPPWLSVVLTALRAQRTLEPDVRALAQHVGVHPAHLMRAFRQHVGVPVGEYRRAMQVANASVELRTSRERIGDIAIAHGFADQSHFARTFVRFMNMTPHEYRGAYATATSAARADRR